MCIWELLNLGGLNYCKTLKGEFSTRAVANSAVDNTACHCSVLPHSPPDSLLVTLAACRKMCILCMFRKSKVFRKVKTVYMLQEGANSLYVLEK